MKRAAHTDGEVRALWLWKAVGKGNPQASVELATMYVQGSGVVRNCDQAQILLRGAAEKGNEQARFSLQQMRLQGGCTPRR
jgi:TPR repeat protein